jgi:hypothetical protein
MKTPGPFATHPRIRKHGSTNDGGWLQHSSHGL